MTTTLHSTDGILSRVFNDPQSALTVTFTDEYGFHAEFTPMGEQRVAVPVGLVGQTFVGDTLDTIAWTSTILNSGIADQGHAQIEIGSGTESNGSSILQTTMSGRYQAGTSNRYRAIVQLSDTGVAGNTRKWGIFNGTDGALFELVGTALYACTFKGGVRNEVANITAYLTSNCTSYEIYITNGTVYFAIGSSGLVATHRALTTTWSDTLNLPLYISSVNSGNTTNAAIYTRVASLQALGTTVNNTQWKNISTNGTAVPLKNSPGRLHCVINNNNAGTLTLYDGLTATNPIAAIDFVKVFGTIWYDLDFQTALCYTTTGSPNTTVTWE